MKTISCVPLAAIVLQLLPWTPLLAQTGASTIQGTVRDLTGAVVPGAKVKIVHVATSLARDTETNGVGFYSFPQTSIGRYRLTVQYPGMLTWEGDLEASPKVDPRTRSPGPGRDRREPGRLCRPSVVPGSGRGSRRSVTRSRTKPGRLFGGLAP